MIPSSSTTGLIFGVVTNLFAFCWAYSYVVQYSPHLPGSCMDRTSVRSAFKNSIVA